MQNPFVKYYQFREETGETPNHVTSHIKLQGSGDFSPLVVDKNTRPNLRLLIKAFTHSPNIGVGYTTIDKNKGEVEPNLKKKTLYLTGGAVRDHLKKKTPRNYDLVTDATPSEIRMILSHGETRFKETKPRSPEHANLKKYSKLPDADNSNKIFYASRWDKQGKELEFTVEINGEKFDLAPLSKSSKSRKAQVEKSELASTIEDDSHNRDFTFNAMYIPLKNPDGENKDLIDPHGGAHHLKSGEVKAIGDNFEKRLSEDPETALKYISLINKYSPNKKMPENYQSLLAKYKDKIGNKKDAVRREFIAGLEHPDTDPKSYIKFFKSTGLMNNIFPGLDYDTENDPVYLKGDRWLSSAWMARHHDPDEVKNILLQGGWSNREASDIAFLVKLYQTSKKHGFDPRHYAEIDPKLTGLTKNKVHDWMKMAKIHGPAIDKHFSYDINHPDVVGKDGSKYQNPINFPGI